MDRFSRFNPKVTLLFFFAEIVLVIAVFNPVLTAVSFISACIYKIMFDGRNGFVYILKFTLPLIFFVMLFNFIFAHYGATVLFEIRMMSFTLESLFYGFAQGLMLASVLLWFNLYSQVITSERFLSVFGRFAPNAAMIFSMVLSFIPRLKKNVAEINEARALMNTTESKLKKSIGNFSALITMTLEESIETADSMKARGFNEKRTVYSKYRFSAADLIMLIFIAVSAVLVIVFKATGGLVFIFEPVISMGKLSAAAVISYCLLAFLPVIINFAEGVRWYYLKQKA